MCDYLSVLIMARQDFALIMFSMIPLVLMNIKSVRGFTKMFYPCQKWCDYQPETKKASAIIIGLLLYRDVTVIVIVFWPHGESGPGVLWMR